MSRQMVKPGGSLDIVTPQEMDEMLAKRRTNVRFAMGGAEGIEQLLNDTPMKGTLTQVTSFHRGDGNDGLVVAAATFTDVCDFDPARIAGTIQNIGSNPALLYLGRYARELQQQAQGNIKGVIVGFLAASGGVFDFKLTNDVWAGPVCAYSTLGTTLVWGTH